MSCRNGYNELLVLYMKLLLNLLTSIDQNMASLSLVYKYHFGRCLSEMAELVARFEVIWCKTQLLRIKNSDTSSMWFMCPAACGSCAIAVPSARLLPINILLTGYIHEKQVVAKRNKNKSYSFAVV